MRNFEQWSQVENVQAQLEQLQSLLGAYTQLYLDHPMEELRQMLPLTYADQNNLMSLMLTVTQDAAAALRQATEVAFAEARREKNA